MAKLEWDQAGDRLFETGVDRGVLFVGDDEGGYEDGVAWNGLTAVNESPTGGEASKQYADNNPYLNFVSAEEFAGSIEAFTYPDEFEVCQGAVSPLPGMKLGQQTRKRFGFSYRTKIGNDLVGDTYGYKIHLVYGALATPAEKNHATQNENPEAMTLSWNFTTMAEAATINGVEYKPMAHLEFDSTKLKAGQLEALEKMIYGDTSTAPTLKTPSEIYTALAAITQ